MVELRRAGTPIPAADAWIAATGGRWMPPIAHAEAVQRLTWHHGDPLDRLLVAQAVSEGLTLVTRDPLFKRYGVRIRKA